MGHDRLRRTCQSIRFSRHCCSMRHDIFMQRCLELAVQGRGMTGANPMVGAVLVRDGKIIAEGFHEGYGKAHAERQLVQKFAQKISSLDTLYVSLEPCCHEKKKTPPCARFLIEKGIKHVVYGMRDPNPQVAGKGIELLRKNGVEVRGPVLFADCRRLNRGFVSMMEKGRPWITLKSAHTSDGKIANDDGSPKQITSKEQNEWSHRFLRATHDAILVGIGTVLNDNPQLNVRLKDVKIEPWRIVLDAELKMPLDAKIAALKTIVVCHNGSKEKVSALQKKGVRVLDISYENGVFDWDALWRALMTPEKDFHGITSILVEGGAKTWKAFKDHAMVDEEIALIG